MDKRNNLMIKTKYSDLETAKSCVEEIGRSNQFVNGSGKFYGEFENNQFSITSSGKLLGVFEFIGEFVEGDEGILMQGSIEKREDIMKRHKLMFLFIYAFAFVLFISLNPIFVMMAVLFVLVPIINKRVIDKSNAFYKAILKRVTG